MATLYVIPARMVEAAADLMLQCHSADDAKNVITEFAICNGYSELANKLYRKAQTMLRHQGRTLPWLNEHLRAALQEIAGEERSVYESGTTHGALREIARRALEK